MAGAGYKQWVDGDILTAGDVNTYLMDQAVMVFADAAARTAAITSPTEGMISFRKDDDVLEYYTGSAWSLMQFGLRQIVTYTSSGTFTKASYPWLRAIRAHVLGAGGGAGGAATTGAATVAVGGGGGGGGYVAALITNIAGLSASETITIGSGGAGGNNADGSAGGNTSAFGLTGNGGAGGFLGTAAAALTAFSGSGAGGSSSGTGNYITVTGKYGDNGISLATNRLIPGEGGANFLFDAGIGIFVVSTSANGSTGTTGVGGRGARNITNDATARTGGNGGNGYVMLELFG